MPVVHCVRVMPHSAATLYNLAADVTQYPSFVPWCQSARVLRWHGAVFDAELEIGYGILSETFTTRVTGTPNSHLQMEPLSGPFKEFAGQWRFEELPTGGTRVQLEVRFEFSSRLLQLTAGAVFERATQSIIVAFEQRAQVVQRTLEAPL